MSRKYGQVTPKKRLAMQIARATIPAVGLVELGNFYGLSCPTVVSATRDIPRNGLIEALPAMEADFMEAIERIEKRKPRLREWAEEFFEALTNLLALTTRGLDCNKPVISWLELSKLEGVPDAKARAMIEDAARACIPFIASANLAIGLRKTGENYATA